MSAPKPSYFVKTLSAILIHGFIGGAPAHAARTPQVIPAAAAVQNLTEIFAPYTSEGPRAAAESLSWEIFNQNRSVAMTFLTAKLSTLGQLPTFAVSNKNPHTISVNLGSESIDVAVIDAQKNLVMINGKLLTIKDASNPEALYQQISTELAPQARLSPSALRFIWPEAHALTPMATGLIVVGVIAVVAYLLYRNNKNNKEKEQAAAQAAADKAAKKAESQQSKKELASAKKAFDHERGAWEGRCGAYPEGTEHRNFTHANKATFAANIRSATEEIKHRPCGSSGNGTSVGTDGSTISHTI